MLHGGGVGRYVLFCFVPVLRRVEMRRTRCNGHDEKVGRARKDGYHHFHSCHHIIDHALHMGIGRSRLVQGLSLSPSAIGRE